jgi:hypothetical protein
VDNEAIPNVVANLLQDIARFRPAEEEEEEAEADADANQEQGQEAEYVQARGGNEVPIAPAPPIAAAVIDSNATAAEEKKSGLQFNAAMLQGVQLQRVVVEQKASSNPISSHLDTMEWALRKQQAKKLVYWQQKLGEVGVVELLSICKVINEVRGAGEEKGLDTEHILVLADRLRALQSTYGADQETAEMVALGEGIELNRECVYEVHEVSDLVRKMQATVHSVRQLAESKMKRIEACERSLNALVKAFVAVTERKSFMWTEEARLQFVDTSRERVKSDLVDMFAYLNDYGFKCYSRFCHGGDKKNSRKMTKFDREAAARAAYRICDTIEGLVGRLRELALLVDDQLRAKRQREVIQALLDLSRLSKDVIVNILEPYDSGLCDFQEIKAQLFQKVYIEGVYVCVFPFTLIMLDLHYTVLHYTMLYFTTLYYTSLHYITLHYTT